MENYSETTVDIQHGHEDNRTILITRGLLATLIEKALEVWAVKVNPDDIPEEGIQGFAYDPWMGLVFSSITAAPASITINTDDPLWDEVKRIIDEGRDA